MLTLEDVDFLIHILTAVDPEYPVTKGDAVAERLKELKKLWSKEGLPVVRAREKRKRLLNIKDTADNSDTTILIERIKSKFPDDDRIVYRETENVVFHQIGGTYKTLEDFNHQWQDKPDQVEKTVLCPKCREPITYFTPKLDELVNFTCMDILDARRLTNALIELLKDREGLI